MDDFKDGAAVAAPSLAVKIYKRRALARKEDKR